MQASQVDWVVRDFEPAISTSVKAKVFLMLAVCVLSHLGISFEQKKKKNSTFSCKLLSTKNGNEKIVRFRKETHFLHCHLLSSCQVLCHCSIAGGKAETQ